MKNTRLILIALFTLGIGFFSCSSDDDYSVLQEPPQGIRENIQKASSKQKPRLVKVITVLFGEPGFVSRDEIMFTYNANGQLSKIRCSSCIKKINFFYSNSLLDSIETIEETTKGIIKEKKRYKFSYKNGGLKEVNEYHFKNDIWDSKIKYLITTDHQGRIVTVKKPANTANTDTYEYDENGNISKLKYSDDIAPTYYTYTDRLNPFSNLPVINFRKIYQGIVVNDFMQPNNNLMSSIYIKLSKKLPNNSDWFPIYWLNSSEYNYQGYTISSIYQTMFGSGKLSYYYEYE